VIKKASSFKNFGSSRFSVDKKIDILRKVRIEQNERAHPLRVKLEEYEKGNKFFN